MSFKQDFPYPTPVEIIRAVAKALDIKSANKILDDKAFERNIDYRQIEKLIDESITEPINKYIGTKAADIITKIFREMLSNYLKLVSNISADGIHREQMIPVLLRSFFKGYLVSLLNQVFNQFTGPNPVTFFSQSDHAVSITINWIRQNQDDWERYFLNMDKEQQDRISAWSRGIDLPSSQYIYLLSSWSKGPWPEQINWQKVKVLLLISRAIESLKRNTSFNVFIDEVRLALWRVKDGSDVVTEIKIKQEICQKEISEIFPTIAEIQHRLKRTTPKNSPDRGNLLHHIGAARTYLKEKNKISPINYWLDWHEARWHTLSGDLDEANKLYKLAFNDCLFRSGENQKLILEEALVVAANVTCCPDKVLLKHLKLASIMFGYDIPSVSGDQMGEWLMVNVD